MPESGTTIEDIDLKVVPINDGSSTKKRKDIETNLELDAERNLIILNLYNLEFRGSADMTVDDVKEKFNIEAEFSVARIELSFSTSTTAEGNIVPQVEVSEVEFKLDDDLIRVSGFGGIPMYKTHGFENEIKQWL